MILRRDAGLKLSLRPAGSSSRMSHLARLRRELDETTPLHGSSTRRPRQKKDEGSQAGR